MPPPPIYQPPLPINNDHSLNMSYNFCNGFLAKCFETKILWNLERRIITTAPAWRPSLHYHLECQGGIQITNTYFRQQPANQRCNTDCLQYLKSDIVICKTLLIVYSNNSQQINAAIATVYYIWNLILQTCQVSRFNRETHGFLCFLTISRLSPQISQFSELMKSSKSATSSYNKAHALFQGNITLY